MNKKKPPVEVKTEYHDYPEPEPFEIKERTAKDFLEDMLASDDQVDWMDILAVARQIRNGRWYDETREALQKMGIMPTSLKEIKQDSKRILEKMKKYNTWDAIKKRSRSRSKLG